MLFKVVCLIFLLLAAPQGAAGAPQVQLPDVPDEPRPAQASQVKDPATYADALKMWRSIQDINAWIGRCFAYDQNRALRLSETQRKAGRKTAILSPKDLYSRQKGVCVDLARFGKETAARIAPQSKPRYLMIEFAPVVVKGNVMRRHWLVVFEKDSGFYSFADSRRPGYMAGPYDSLENLITDYGKYRGRKIVSYKILNDYRKKALRKKRKRRAE